jgi:thiamine biosynthesis lipoprotein
VSCQLPETTHVDTRADGTTAFSGDAMTMHYKILIGETLSKNQITKIKEIIQKTFAAIDTTFNKWNPNSELSKLNSQKSGITTALSPDLLRLFKETDPIVALSKGKFDPTIEPLQALWKLKLEKGTIPTEAEIQTIAPAIGWDKISFTDGQFTKSNDFTKLDFGGIAKGLSVDILVERLTATGFSNLYVEWGGEIRVTGKHPQGRPWTVYISRLGDTDPDNAIATLHLEDQAIATSGDYLQNWTVKFSRNEGDEKESKPVTYFHIFDPVTLRPIEASHTSVASVSVVAPSCAMADGLATIAMMFPTVSEATLWAEEIKERFPDVSFWIVSREGL